jgi:SAM-dependent methyltransferase
MKLSELVDYKNLIDTFSLNDIHHEARHRLDGVIHNVVTHQLQFENYSRQLTETGHGVDRAFDAVQSTVDQIRSHLVKNIADLEPEYYQASTRLYQDEMCYETNEYILNRRMHLDNASADLLQGRIVRYTNWRVPGLIFRPGLESFIEQLVPLDPLYVVDQNLELLEPAVSKFTPEYQRRLRLYAVDDRVNDPVLKDLPNEQFGYIFAYNYFNFKPRELIEQYIREFWDKLRPGGVAFMTINDCDYSHGVALAENSFMTYTPGNIIIKYAEELGFEINDQYRGEGNVAWLEIQRPGEIHSLRGGQTLAKIVHD